MGKISNLGQQLFPEAHRLTCRHTQTHPRTYQVSVQFHCSATSSYCSVNRVAAQSALTCVDTDLAVAQTHAAQLMFAEVGLCCPGWGEIMEKVILLHRPSSCLRAAALPV